jgi:hypothetical protein
MTPPRQRGGVGGAEVSGAEDGDSHEAHFPRVV